MEGGYTHVFSLTTTNDFRGALNLNAQCPNLQGMEKRPILCRNTLELPWSTLAFIAARYKVLLYATLSSNYKNVQKNHACKILCMVNSGRYM